MQGPGRPALVPFQDGLRPGKGQAEGTMWWDNIPDGKFHIHKSLENCFLRLAKQDLVEAHF